MKDDLFNDLERQWRFLLTRLSNRWTIPGMGRDDVYQELLLILWKTSQGYDPSRGVMFKSYLYRACLNRLQTICNYEGIGRRPRKRLTPPEKIVSLDKVSGAEGAMYDNLSLIDMFTGASSEARGVARRVMLDEFNWRTAKRIGPHVKNELRKILKGDEKDGLLETR